LLLPVSSFYEENAFFNHRCDYKKLVTFPRSMSSLCAAEAALTKADVAAAIDFAASKIISSKFRLSSAS